MTATYSNLQDLKQHLLPRIEAQLDSWLTVHASHEQASPEQGLFVAARYSTLSTGKRFRPLLTLAVATRYGIPIDRVIAPACSIELVHTYSLIHDDLPCMDNDDFRRGKKTLHKIIGEGLALLTGDFLLTLAFQCLAKAPDLDAITRLRLISCISDASGHQGLVGGQYADLTSHQHPQTFEFVQWMHKRKTGSLMRASVEFGAILSGLDEATTKRWDLFADRFGLLFQLADDLVDSLPNPMKSSMPIGPSSSLTFATVEQTLKEVVDLKAQLLNLCRELDPDRTILNEMIDTVCKQYEELPQIAGSIPGSTTFA